MRESIVSDYECESCELGSCLWAQVSSIDVTQCYTPFTQFTQNPRQQLVVQPWDTRMQEGYPKLRSSASGVHGESNLTVAWQFQIWPTAGSMLPIQIQVILCVTSQGAPHHLAHGRTQETQHGHGDMFFGTRQSRIPVWVRPRCSTVHSGSCDLVLLRMHVSLYRSISLVPNARIIMQSISIINPTWPFGYLLRRKLFSLMSLILTKSERVSTGCCCMFDIPGPVIEE